MQFRFVAHSEIGLVRKNNQDSGYATSRLLVVADGMGGAAAGDLASAVAIDRIRRIDPAPADPAPADPEPTDQPTDAESIDTQPADPEPADVPDDAAPTDEPDDAAPDPTGPANPWVSAAENTAGEDAVVLLAGAISKANDRLADLIADDHALDGMGTTVSAVMVADEHYAIAHIGDSRAYLLRDGEFSRLTHDHSWVQSLVDDGRLTEEEANYHPHRSLLLRVLNGQPQFEPDLTLHDAVAGDRVLVCSDGLCGFVPDEVLAERVRLADPDEALAALITDAHIAGGSDNITIILADLVDEDSTPTPVVLGAAAERDIPAVGTRPKVDLGDDDPRPPTAVDERGNPVPDAPPPRSGRRGDSEHDRYAPRVAPPLGRRWGRALLVVLVVALVVAGGVGGTYAWARTQYFVAPNNDQVGIYRGLNEELGSYRLNELYESHDIEIADLPRMFRDQLAGGIAADDLTGARATVDELRTAADTCRRVRSERQTPTPTPTPTAPPTTTSPEPTGEQTPSAGSPTGTPQASPTAVASDGPSPTPTRAAPTPFDENDC